MIGSIVFVIAFVGLGLTVVFAAMAGGRRRSGAARRREGPGKRRAWLLGLTLGSVLIGVGVPLWVMVANGTSRAQDGPGGVKLTDGEADGRHLFAVNCSTCHTLEASAAVGKVGPDLDVLHPPKNLVLDAIAKGRARGQGQMPAMLLTGQDAQNVAAYVAKVAGR